VRNTSVVPTSWCSQFPTTDSEPYRELKKRAENIAMRGRIVFHLWNGVFCRARAL
jgi:hypothetical protein